MFTGIVQAVGTVVSASPRGSGLRLAVAVGTGTGDMWPGPPRPGDSVSVSGCCLTVAEVAKGGGVMVFDAVAETLRRTTLGFLVAGAAVNLEQSVTPSTLLGGHVVQGHIDAVGDVVAADSGEGGGVRGGWRLRVKVAAAPEVGGGAEPAAIEMMAPKGSVTVDGVSLTIARVEPDRTAGGGGGWGGWFEAALIPATLERTTLGGLAVGDRVNIETDAVMRTVVYWLRNFGPGVR